MQYSQHSLFDAAVYPGILSALSMIQVRGWPLYIATSKPGAYAIRIAEHFDLMRYFRGIFGSEFDGTRSSKADLLRNIVVTGRLDPAHTAMIGDREHDMRGAQANTLRSIGVLWGFGTRAELLAAGADTLCDTPADLPRKLGLQSADSSA
jgi:phosphoglycolate phosphatase